MNRFWACTRSIPASPTWIFTPPSDSPSPTIPTSSRPQTNPVGVSYTTLDFGGHLQLGSPDSVYSEGYDTILALDAKYLFWADIFDHYSKFDAPEPASAIAGPHRAQRGDLASLPQRLGCDRQQPAHAPNSKGGCAGNESAPVSRAITISRPTSPGARILPGRALNHPNNVEYINQQSWRSYQELNYPGLSRLQPLRLGRIPHHPSDPGFQRARK